MVIPLDLHMSAPLPHLRATCGVCLSGTLGDVASGSVQGAWPVAPAAAVDTASPQVSRYALPRAGHRSTSFETCTPTPFLLKNLSKYGRAFFSGKIACKGDEEESCNVVHATCSKVLKVKTTRDIMNAGQKVPGYPCNPDKKPGFLDSLAPGVSGLSALFSVLNPVTPQGNCNARMFDMPYGLLNNDAMKYKGKTMQKLLLGIKKFTLEARPEETVWGIAVHGLTGTWAFDSGTTHAGDYLYQIPQEQGLSSDYYLCDSRDGHPHYCALIGGNMRNVCAQWYDPVQCSECEDMGASLKCQIRGWNDMYNRWTRVPIYPRDMLGELYRNEWQDVQASPSFASVIIRKEAFLKDIPTVPENLVSEKGPARKAVNKSLRDAPYPLGGFSFVEITPVDAHKVSPWQLATADVRAPPTSPGSARAAVAAAVAATSAGRMPGGRFPVRKSGSTRRGRRLRGGGYAFL
eukprot:TRINITY_DN74095_c0_g1_i1.p1 TRINITY_DN74095_c0_g1~~TRINITY_DN74095_c0_g1_i1.p1  ORF type:complete len:461 (-),score=63.85 TRINITY_DN74095_c0_g1_i1:70-1452(-)